MSSSPATGEVGEEEGKSSSRIVMCAWRADPCGPRDPPPRVQENAGKKFGLRRVG